MCYPMSELIATATVLVSPPGGVRFTDSASFIQIDLGTSEHLGRLRRHGFQQSESD